MAQNEYSELYDSKYYSNYGIAAGTDPVYDNPIMHHIMSELAKYLVGMCHPEAVLDVGCAYNLFVHYCVKDYGLNNSLGVDISQDALQKSLAPNNHLLMDISSPFDLGRKFDLVTSIEVIEHLTFADAQIALDNIVKHAGKYIFFSSTSDHFDDPTHITVLPQKVWVEEFKKRGFVKYEHFCEFDYIPHAMLFLNQNLFN